MAKVKISITVDRDILRRADLLCGMLGDNRSAVLERLCAIGLEAESAPGDAKRYVKMVAPISVIKTFMANLEVVGGDCLMEMLLWFEESRRREWSSQVGHEARNIKDDAGGVE